jgi:heat shock protein HslJ
MNDNANVRRFFPSAQEISVRRVRMRRLGSFLLAAFLFATAGTSMIASAQTPEAASDSLVGTTWELMSMEVEAGSSVAIENSGSYTVYFIEEGQIVVTADCNTMLGTYTIDGDMITITGGPMTLAYCGDESHSDAFVLSLTSAAMISTNEIGELILTPGEGADEGAGTLTFQRSLLGTIWRWTVFQSSDDSEITPEDPSRFTIEFIDEDTVAIGADCNRGRGIYTRNGSEIDIDIQLLTRAYCGDDSLHDQYIQFLDEAVSVVFVDGGMHLSMPMDAGIMSFSPVAYGPAGTPEAGS